MAMKYSGQLVSSNSRLMTTTVVDSQTIKQIRELEKDSEGVAKLQIPKRLNGLHFAEVSTRALSWVRS